MVRAFTSISNVSLVASYAGSLAPVANAGPDQTVTEGASVFVNGTGSYDPEAQPLTYQWTQTAGLPVTLINPTFAILGFIAPTGLTQHEVLLFQLVVNDGITSSAPDTVEIRVLANPPVNQPPTVSNACLSTPRGVSMGGFVNATDPDSTSLTYALVSGGTAGLSDGKKGNVTINSVTGEFTYTPCAAPGATACVPASSGTGFQGMDKITFRVTDPLGQSSTGVATILIDGAVRIMPLGDSITEGVTSSTGCSGTSCPALGSDRIGYRKKLYDDLEALSPNYAVRMVGSRFKGENAGLLAPNNAQEGHPGWCAGPTGDGSSYCSTTVSPEGVPRNLADNVISWLNTNQPDIILLHAGTNSFTTSASDMALLLNAIDTWQAANYPVTVFLARILQNAPPGSDNVQLFNDNVAAIVGTRRVITVNQQTGANIVYSIGVDMGDDIHPNQTGYNKMAAKWLTDMTNPANVGPKFIGLPSCP
jgi:lysophospholipase L1-like esterase